MTFDQWFKKWHDDNPAFSICYQHLRTAWDAGHESGYDSGLANGFDAGYDCGTYTDGR